MHKPQHICKPRRKNKSRDCVSGLAACCTDQGPGVMLVGTALQEHQGTVGHSSGHTRKAVEQESSEKKKKRRKTKTENKTKQKKD